MQTLTHTLEKLKSNPNVDAVFLTGSSETGRKPHSDIDMVIILKKHDKDLSAIYTWIDDTFADIFFFDHADLDRMEKAELLPGNGMDAIFLNWLRRSVIQFDDSGRISGMKDMLAYISVKVGLPQSEKDTAWQKINYNFVANTRYFESNDPIYHNALEIRLLYSVSEIITGYCTLRNIYWRGEKLAIMYFQKMDTPFYNAFIEYTKATNIQQRFEAYKKLVELVFTDEYKMWNKGDVISQAKGGEINKDGSVEYWKELIQ